MATPFRPAVRRLPYQQQLQPDQHGLHFVPSEDFQRTANPNHVAANFSSNCENAMTPWRGRPASFDHSMVNFPLTGAHTVPPRQCARLPRNNNYNLTSTTCMSCHLKDFQNAKNPNHVAGGFRADLRTCHATSAWQPATFDHSKSGFPLTGSHMVPPRRAADCHINNNYSITTTACITCHQNDFNDATSQCRMPASRRPANSATTPCSGPTATLITPQPAFR